MKVVSMWKCENVEIWKSRFPNYQISRLANLVLFAEGFRRRSQHAWHTEGLGEIARDAKIHGFDGAGLVREASDDDHGEIGFQPARFADHGEPVDAGHLQVGDQQVIGNDAQALERGAAVGRHVHVVFGERERLRQQVADRRLVVDDEDARAAGGGLTRGRRRGGARTAARTLALEPRVDVALAEPPLAADADRGNLACFDQAIDGPQVHLEVLEDLLGGQKALVDHGWLAVPTLPPTPMAGSSMWNTAPPSSAFAAAIVPPCSATIP